MQVRHGNESRMTARRLGSANPACRHWLVVALVMLMPLENAAVRCAATPLSGTATTSVAAGVVTIDTTASSDQPHQCCAHQGSGGGERSCSVHCLPVTALIHALQSTIPAPLHTTAQPSTSTLIISALAIPDLRPPIPS